MARFKNRYIVVKVFHGAKKQGIIKVKSEVLARTITKTVKEMYGDFGLAAIKAGLQIKYCNERTHIAVIRVRHGPHQFVARSLPCIKFVDSKPTALHTLYTGASLCQCYKFLRVYQIQQLEKMWSKLKTDEKKIQMEKAVMDFAPLSMFKKSY